MIITQCWFVVLIKKVFVWYPSITTQCLICCICLANHRVLLSKQLSVACFLQCMASFVSWCHLNCPCPSSFIKHLTWKRADKYTAWSYRAHNRDTETFMGENINESEEIQKVHKVRHVRWRELCCRRLLCADIPYLTLQEQWEKEESEFVKWVESAWTMRKREKWQPKLKGNTWMRQDREIEVANNEENQVSWKYD